MALTRICERCGVTFAPRGWVATRHRRRFCSRQCSDNRSDPAERFWAKVNKDGPIHPVIGTACWLWTGATKHGYGAFATWKLAQRYISAHRWAYEQAKGPIPVGYELDHLCRCPACVNPDHLEPVTHLVNMSRGHFGRVTHCPHGHPYDAENTLVTPTGGRWCRACGRRRAARYRLAQHAKRSA